MNVVKSLRISMFSVAVVVLSACAADPTIQSGEDAEVVMGTLSKVDNSRADLAYVDPEGDYGRYTRVYVAPLDLDNVEILQPANSGSLVNRYNEEWVLTDTDKEELQGAFDKAMKDALIDDGSFDIATAAGDDVIRVEAMLTRIAPLAPKDDTDSRGVSRSTVYTSGAGDMSVAIMLADGDSGEVLAVLKDTRRDSNSTWRMNNKVSNMAEVRRKFNAWANLIHDGLLDLRDMGESQ